MCGKEVGLVNLNFSSIIFIDMVEHFSLNTTLWTLSPPRDVAIVAQNQSFSYWLQLNVRENF